MTRAALRQLLPALALGLAPTLAAAGDEWAVLDSPGNRLLEQSLLEQVRAQYRDRTTDVNASALSPGAAREYRERKRKNYRKILGERPEKSPLNAKTTGGIQTKRYRIENVVYESRPGHRVTANLYIPSGKGPWPGVLVACGHAREGKAYEPYQKVSALLAANGFVALIYDPIGQGERLQLLDGPDHSGWRHKLLNVNSLPVGRNAVTYMTWDSERSLDYLLSRQEVDQAKPIGMTGNSGGGAQTMYLMALDDRIGPAAPSCHITTLERNFDLGGAGDGCQSAPLTGRFEIEHPDFLIMHMPRPTIVLSAERDYKDIHYTRETVAEAAKFAKVLGVSDSLDMFAYDDEHAFSRPRREAAVRWMRHWLYDDPRTVAEPDDLPVHPETALHATPTGQVLTSFSDERSVVNLNREVARRLAKRRKQRWGAASVAERRETIRSVLAIGPGVPKPAVTEKGRVEREGLSVTKLILDAGFPLPALLVEPRRVEGRRVEGRLPAVLQIDGRSKSFERAQAVADMGKIVLAVDLRGFGETFDPGGTRHYTTGEHGLAMWSFHIGKPLLGLRVWDAMAALEYLAGLSTVDTFGLEVQGVGPAGPVAMHLAALDDRVAELRVLDSIKSWEHEFLNRPLDGNEIIGSAVPGALAHYDLDELQTLKEVAARQ